MNDNITITGIGWLDETEYGSVKRQLHAVCPKGNCPGTVLAACNTYPVPKWIGRFDAVSRHAYCAIALALQDSGFTHNPGRFVDIGILGTNNDGALITNKAYFRDYVECGRTLSRGNLFIYTLPTSPLAETAIHFGLRGPMFYMSGPTVRITELIQTATGIIKRSETDGMIVVKADHTEGLAFILSSTPGNDQNSICSSQYVLDILSTEKPFREMISLISAPIG
ncbi:MAG: hypothetical protein JXN60_09810 [Lentisphaerae bacterium]|nr:hypothetical protein [Lentisphaerota bacterium]